MHLHKYLPLRNIKQKTQTHCRSFWDSINNSVIDNDTKENHLRIYIHIHAHIYMNMLIDEKQVHVRFDLSSFPIKIARITQFSKILITNFSQYITVLLGKKCFTSNLGEYF